MSVRVGIDIGGTQLRVAALDEKSHILRRESFSNDHNVGPRENLRRLADAIEGWGSNTRASASAARVRSTLRAGRS